MNSSFIIIDLLTSKSFKHFKLITKLVMSKTKIEMAIEKKSDKTDTAAGGQKQKCITQNRQLFDLSTTSDGYARHATNINELVTGSQKRNIKKNKLQKIYGSTYRASLLHIHL